MGEKEFGNEVVVTFASTFSSALSAIWLGKNIEAKSRAGSFPHSSDPTAATTSNNDLFTAESAVKRVLNSNTINKRERK